MKKTDTLVLPAIGAAIISVLAQITLPIGPVPFTLQSLAIGLIATLFRPREAILSVGLYLLLGGIGLPVFTGGTAGIYVLSGPTAGYLWGFLLYAVVASFLTHPRATILQIFLANLLGDSLVFISGALGLHFFTGMSFEQAITVGILPFLLPDLGKLVAISLLSQPLFKSLKGQIYFQ